MSNSIVVIGRKCKDQYTDDKYKMTDYNVQIIKGDKSKGIDHYARKYVTQGIVSTRDYGTVIIGDKIVIYLDSCKIKNKIRRCEWDLQQAIQYGRGRRADV